MQKTIIHTFILVLLTTNIHLWAECPLDHFIIGCNPDGIWGTADDNDLFVNTWQKYRNSGDSDYSYRYYPLTRAASFITNHPYRLGEPGFDAYQADTPSSVITYDPCHALAGTPWYDYEVALQCISLSQGLRVVHKDSPTFTIDAVGEQFSHSDIHEQRDDAHIHLSYQADDGEALRWITWQVVDILDDGNTYNPSEPFTVIFNTDPNEGDIVIDGAVNMLDLVSLAKHWQDPNASIENDYYERADTNQDGVVDLEDYQCLSEHWTAEMAPLEACGLMKAYLDPNSFLEQFHIDVTKRIEGTDTGQD